MTKKACIILSLLLLVSTILPYHSTLVGHASSYDEEFVIKSSVRFTTYGGAWNFTEEEKAISLYMNNTWQTVYLINSSHPIERVSTDEDGNAIAVLNMSDIGAGESIEYTVLYQVISKPRNLPNIDGSTAQSLANIPNNLTDPYLKNSGTWMINNPALKNQADLLTGTGTETNVLVIVENIVQWIWNNVRYKPHEVPLYPNETLSMKEGDCDDRAILLISLCRIIGIPAYLQVGCIYLDTVKNESSTGWGGHVENVQNHIAWHGWAMVYIPPWGWLPVDLTYTPESDPLGAIRKAAVTLQYVIQYMNIIKTDYATDARQYRRFLQNNGYYIWAYDEIIPGHGADPFAFIYESLMKYALLVFLFAVFAGCVVVLFFVRRWRKRTPTLMETTSPSSPVSYTRKSS